MPKKYAVVFTKTWLSGDGYAVSRCEKETRRVEFRLKFFARRFYKKVMKQEGDAYDAFTNQGMYLIKLDKDGNEEIIDSITGMIEY